MIFACQKDSFLQTLQTKVISCEPGQLKTKVNGKDSVNNGYDIVLADTILFPEGGGQPDDRGTIGGVSVLRVTRQNGQAVHFADKPLQPDSEVTLNLDWTRRFDHMQQHSGQHLISALAENNYNYPTTSWSLGEAISTIEFDTPNFSQDKLDELEEACNASILAAIPVKVVVYESKEAAADSMAKTRGLPEDHMGPVRVIEIGDFDKNMCCGTHVNNLSQLQGVKFLYSEKGKKNKTLVAFVAGKRVINYLNNCVKREVLITSLIKGGPEEHVSLIDKVQKSLKLSQKNETTLSRDVATLEAKIFKTLKPAPKYITFHRKDVSNDFASVLINEIGDENVLIFVTIGDDKGSGMMTLAGKPELVSTLGPKLCELMEGKGNAKGNKYFGKVNNLKLRAKAEELLKIELEQSEHLQNGDS